MKHLSRLDVKAKQLAEVAVYFKRFDEAEQLYHKMDRPDLAIDMRMRLGGCCVSSAKFKRLDEADQQLYHEM